MPDKRHPNTTNSRTNAEQKLIECRQLFLGFLRRRLASPQDAEDVFQDFCIKVIRRFDTIEDEERIDAWLSATLRNTLTDHYRRRATRTRGAEDYARETLIFNDEAEEPTTPACRCIRVAMQELNPAQAELLKRTDLEGEPRKKVAVDMGLNLNALGVRVHRARAALKKKIADFCPTCGNGDFMRCDCDLGQSNRSFSLPSRTDLPVVL